MRATLVLIRCFEEVGIPWCLENPASSNMWHIPRLVALAKLAHVQLIEVDQCSFGQPWRKRTKLMFSRCDPQDVEALAARHKCHGRRVCDFSQREHIQLTGSGLTANHLQNRLRRSRPRCAARLLDCFWPITCTNGLVRTRGVRGIASVTLVAFPCSVSQGWPLTELFCVPRLAVNRVFQCPKVGR